MSFAGETQGIRTAPPLGTASPACRRARHGKVMRPQSRTPMPFHPEVQPSGDSGVLARQPRKSVSGHAYPDSSGKPKRTARRQLTRAGGPLYPAYRQEDLLPSRPPPPRQGQSRPPPFLSHPPARPKAPCPRLTPAPQSFQKEAGSPSGRNRRSPRTGHFLRFPACVPAAWLAPAADGAVAP